jgi:hypothetical protein
MLAYVLKSTQKLMDSNWKQCDNQHNNDTSHWFSQPCLIHQI